MGLNIISHGGGINIHIAFKNQIRRSSVFPIVITYPTANKRNSIESNAITVSNPYIPNVKKGMLKLGEWNREKDIENGSMLRGLGKYAFFRIKKTACEFRELVLYANGSTNSQNSQTAVNRNVMYGTAEKWQIHKNPPFSHPPLRVGYVLPIRIIRSPYDKSETL